MRSSTYLGFWRGCDGIVMVGRGVSEDSGDEYGEGRGDGGEKILAVTADKQGRGPWIVGWISRGILLVILIRSSSGSDSGMYPETQVVGETATRQWCSSTDRNRFLWARHVIWRTVDRKNWSLAPGDLCSDRSSYGQGISVYANCRIFQTPNM
ncbi:hypothetical protein Tco_1028285 [Tanacetum coccineum]|uniref:Uncharacterized protein n=1 Tax=Tanacetum coccineum TaxID=301880 RepID=A0ABQ5G0J7_9ASTR